nr:Zinc finger, PMZ-type [Ipomoea trifida]
MSTTQRSESMNAFFDGYVNSKTTLKVFVEQYEKALESKVEKEKEADFHSFNSMYECLSNYEMEKQFQRLYTNEKFREFQEELKGKFDCYHSLIKDENPSFVYEVVEDVKVGDKRRDVKFMVAFNEVECEAKCNCHLFEFRGILCRHALLVLILRKVSEIPSRYVLSRWRKDLKRGYTCIRSSYNLSCKETQRCGQMCDAFRYVAIIAASEEEKYKRVMDVIEELKSSLMNGEVINSTTQASCLPQDNEVDKQNMSSGANKVLSPLVTRRKGHPPTKRRVSRLEQVVESLKMKKKRKQIEEKDPKKSRQRQSSISYNDIDCVPIPSSTHKVDEMGTQESFVTTSPMMPLQGFYMVPQRNVDEMGTQESFVTTSPMVPLQGFYMVPQRNLTFEPEESLGDGKRFVPRDVSQYGNDEGESTGDFHVPVHCRTRVT